MLRDQENIDSNKNELDIENNETGVHKNSLEAKARKCDINFRVINRDHGSLETKTNLNDDQTIQSKPCTSEFYDAESCSQHLPRQIMLQAKRINDDPAFNSGRWSKEEHIKFVEAILKHGNEWKEVQKYVKSRSSTQARSHAQKFFLKLKKSDALNSTSQDIGISIQSLHNITNQMNVDDYFNTLKVLHDAPYEKSKSKLKKSIVHSLLNYENIHQNTHHPKRQLNHIETEKSDLMILAPEKKVEETADKTSIKDAHLALPYIPIENNDNKLNVPADKDQLLEDCENENPNLKEAHISNPKVKDRKHIKHVENTKQRFCFKTTTSKTDGKTKKKAYLNSKKAGRSEPSTINIYNLGMNVNIYNIVQNTGPAQSAQQNPRPSDKHSNLFHSTNIVDYDLRNSSAFRSSENMKMLFQPQDFKVCSNTNLATMKLDYDLESFFKSSSYYGNEIEENGFPNIGSIIQNDLSESKSQVFSSADDDEMFV